MYQLPCHLKYWVWKKVPEVFKNSYQIKEQIPDINHKSNRR